MNDLYNMRDVILLCEIIENRFEKMCLILENAILQVL